MRAKACFVLVVLVSFVFAVTLTDASAQSNPRFLQLGSAKGALYTPDSGPAPHVGIVLMHWFANSMSNLASKELAKRGFLALAMNSRFENNPTKVMWEELALDVKAGVDFLRSQPGITAVVLWAHSGGGPTMAFYQAIAEAGPSYCSGSNKLFPCTPSKLTGLNPADGVIFADAHAGNSVVSMLRGLNPAVLNESQPYKLKKKLDPFDPENGFNPDGSSHYSEAFKEAYFRGQAERMNELIDRALRIQKRIEDGKWVYPDDDIFLIPRCGYAFLGTDVNDLRRMDLSVAHTTLRPHKLLKNDGTIETQIIESVRVPELGLEKKSPTFINGTRIFTVNSFLSSFSIRATHSMDPAQIDWCSSNSSVPCMVRVITVPQLHAFMTGFYLIREGEDNYDAAVAAGVCTDLDSIAIEGSTHGFTPCTDCESTPGQYSNVTKNWFDYVRDWINARF